jgi:hypothetical protein
MSDSHRGHDARSGPSPLILPGGASPEEVMARAVCGGFKGAEKGLKDIANWHSRILRALGLYLVRTIHDMCVAVTMTSPSDMHTFPRSCAGHWLHHRVGGIDPH